MNSPDASRSLQRWRQVRVALGILSMLGCIAGVAVGLRALSTGADTWSGIRYAVVGVNLVLVGFFYVQHHILTLESVLRSTPPNQSPEPTSGAGR